jgi:hypothetical protein
MLIQKRMFQSLVGFFMLVLANLTLAQVPSYTVSNPLGNVFYFETLDHARGTWKQQSVQPNQTLRLNITSGMTTAKIRINTPNAGFVEYDVYAGNTYTIFWSANKQKWDFVAEQPQQQSQQQTQKQSQQQRPQHQQGNAPMPYRIGDQVSVLWQGKWYNATVIEMKPDLAKIHYDGYDNSWDEWIDRSRIRFR